MKNVKKSNNFHQAISLTEDTLDSKRGNCLLYRCISVDSGKETHTSKQPNDLTQRRIGSECKSKQRSEGAANWLSTLHVTVIWKLITIIEHRDSNTGLFVRPVILHIGSIRCPLSLHHLKEIQTYNLGEEVKINKSFIRLYP